MASASAIALPSLLPRVSKTHSGNPRAFPGAAAHLGNLRKCLSPAVARGGAAAGRQRISIVAKAVGDSSDSSESIVKYIQDAWDKSEDRIALIGLGFAGIVTIWASSNLIAAIDRLPVIPGFLEFIGVLFSWWFVYRYLLFKPDRAELSLKVKKSLSDILGK